MIEFTLPTKLNGATLIEELKTAKVVLNGIPKVEDNKLYLGVNKTDSAKVQSVLDAHTGENSTDPKQAILERLGLTADEAALLLS